MYHYRKTRKQYMQRRQARVACPFCDAQVRTRTIAENAHARVIPNLTFYDVWETRTVADHLMVVPKRHVHSLKDLSKKERDAVMDLLADYEGQGYNLYARSPDSVTKSIPHQHTHLIKTQHKKALLSVYVRRPYFLFKI